MPECHKCPNNQANSLACLKCSGPSDNLSHHGQSHVSVEEVDGFIPAPVPLAIRTEYDAALHLLKTMSGFGIIEREIIFGRLNGYEYPAITARINQTMVKKITVQGIHARVKKVTARNPALQELFKTMVVKQQKRKQKGQNSEQN